MSPRTEARDAAVAAVGQRRGRGQPRRFDLEFRVQLDADLDRRVRSFAALEQISTSEAWRTLATLALTELEKGTNR